MLNRKGMFFVDIETVETKPEILAKALAEMKFVPMRVECMYYSRQFEYTGISPMFDEIKLGELLGQYDIQVNIDENNEYECVTVNRKV